MSARACGANTEKSISKQSLVIGILRRVYTYYKYFFPFEGMGAWVSLISLTVFGLICYWLMAYTTSRLTQTLAPYFYFFRAFIMVQGILFAPVRAHYRLEPIGTMAFDFKKNRPWAENLQIIMQLGLTMAGCILFCFYVGYKLDAWLKTKGVLLAVFIILGIVGGAITSYRQIMEVFKSNK